MNTVIAPQELADRYAALWNNPSAAIRRAEIRQLWAPQGRHYVRAREVNGYDALETRVSDSHEKNITLGGCFFRARDAQALRDVVTFSWEMALSATGKVESVGFEVLLLDNDGRILVDYQFIL